MLLYCSNTELGPFLPFHSFILWLSLFFTLSFSLLFISLFLCLLYMFVCVCVCVWHIFLTNRKLYVYVQPITNPYTKLKNYLSCGETERERYVNTWLCVCLSVLMLCMCERMNSRTRYERKVGSNYTLLTTTNTTTSTYRR